MAAKEAQCPPLSYSSFLLDFNSPSSSLLLHAAIGLLGDIGRVTSTISCSQYKLVYFSPRNGLHDPAH
jgi:hypothetical protein